MDMDEFLDCYLFFWRNPILPFEACEVKEFHDWLPAWVLRAAQRVIDSRS
jgi:hypothetical protein